MGHSFRTQCLDHRSFCTWKQTSFGPSPPSPAPPHPKLAVLRSRPTMHWGGWTNIAGIRHKRQSVSHIVTRIVGNCVGVAGDKLVYHLCVDEGDGRRERDNSWRFERYPFVSYCLLHGVHFPHQHTVDIPVYSVDPSAYLGRDNLVAFCYWPTES